ncbi:hypothetical protein [Streptosporangium minutum]|uniref:hypothetical protein n=1 Tax=Streptosporangium minutum TaxID=569862 RepID=UPI001F611C30|nr:hypothetical protein [Streptosporangium minutum]
MVAEGPDALARFNGWNDRFWVRSLVPLGTWLGDYEAHLPTLTPWTRFPPPPLSW